MKTASSDMPWSCCVAFFLSNNKKRVGKEEICGFRSSTEKMKIVNCETRRVSTCLFVSNNSSQVSWWCYWVKAMCAYCVCSLKRIKKVPPYSWHYSFYCEKWRASHKTPSFIMEFGQVDRPPGAEGVLMLIIHINWADPPSNNEPCKQLKVKLEVELNRPPLSSESTVTQLSTNGHQSRDSSSASPQRCD